MKITPSNMTVRPAQALPPPPSLAEAGRPAVTDLGALTLYRSFALNAFPALSPTSENLVEQCGEGVASLLEAAGEHGEWPCAVSGGAIGAILGGLRIAEATKHGDSAGMQAGLIKLTVGGLGMVTGSGVFHAHPAIQTGIEIVRTVLGSATPTAQSNALANYGGLTTGSQRR